MKVLGLIPARGGSKGVSRKNIRLLLGKPMLAYTIEAAKNAGRLTRVILSTEDEEIAEVGLKYGVDVPFMRPAELARDTTPTLPVIQHAIESLEAIGEVYDAICLLQPTNPLRRAEDIDNCIELFEETGADSVISIRQVPHEYNPKWVYWKNADGKMVLTTGETAPISRRQDLPPAFHREGSVYVTRKTVLFEAGNLYGTDVHGYEIEPEHSVNIDTLEDWNEVERRLQERLAASDSQRETDFAATV